MKRGELPEDDGGRRGRAGHALHRPRAAGNSRGDQCRSPRRHLHVAAVLRSRPGLRRRAQRAAQVHAQFRRRHHRAGEQRHGGRHNAFVAAAQASAPIRIIAGSGAGGLFVVSQKESGIRSMADLAAAKGKGLKIGTIRSTPSSSPSIAIWCATTSPIATTTSCGSTTHCRWRPRFRGQGARCRHPCRAVRNPPGRPARRRRARRAASTSGVRTARTA